MRPLYRVLSALFLTLGAQAAMAQTGVLAFSPEGAVKGVRQVTARFASPIFRELWAPVEGRVVNLSLNWRFGQ